MALVDDRMKMPLLYLDSSIWSFAVADDAPDLRRATEELFDHIRNLEWGVLISPVVTDEIDRASIEKRDRILSLVHEISPERIEISGEALSLARDYIHAGVLSERHGNDCLHVAIATLARCQYLLSWNFRHLANSRRAERFLEVNRALGYNWRLRICNPSEVYGFL